MRYVRLTRDGGDSIGVTYTSELPPPSVTPIERGLSQCVAQTPNQDPRTGRFNFYSYVPVQPATTQNLPIVKSSVVAPKGKKR